MRLTLRCAYAPHSMNTSPVRLSESAEMAPSVKRSQP